METNADAVIQSIRNKDFTAFRVHIRDLKDVNTPYEDGNTILHLATALDELDFVRILLRKRANTNVKNSSGITPLHIAVKNGNINLCELLMKYGADVTVKNSEQRTPLHLAKEMKNEALIERIQSLVSLKEKDTPAALDLTALSVDGKYLLSMMNEVAASMSSKMYFLYETIAAMTKANMEVVASLRTLQHENTTLKDEIQRLKSANLSSGVSNAQPTHTIQPQQHSNHLPNSTATSTLSSTTTTSTNRSVGIPMFALTSFLLQEEYARRELGFMQFREWTLMMERKDKPGSTVVAVAARVTEISKTKATSVGVNTDTAGLRQLYKMLKSEVGTTAYYDHHHTGATPSLLTFHSPDRSSDRIQSRTPSIPPSPMSSSTSSIRGMGYLHLSEKMAALELEKERIRKLREQQEDRIQALEKDVMEVLEHDDTHHVPTPPRSSVGKPRKYVMLNVAKSK